MATIGDNLRWSDWPGGVRHGRLYDCQQATGGQQKTLLLIPLTSLISSRLDHFFVSVCFLWWFGFHSYLQGKADAIAPEKLLRWLGCVGG